MAVVGQDRVWWAFALASVTSEARGLLAERGAGRGQGRSADQVQLVAPEAAQGQVQSVGQVQWADQAQMEVSYETERTPVARRMSRQFLICQA